MKNTFTLLFLLITGFHGLSQDWSALGDGTGTNQKVIAMESFQGKLIVGGSFILAGGQVVNRIASWDGSSWQPMGTGFDDEVRAMAVYNGDLYAAGRFNNDGSGTVPYAGIAKWNGATWLAIPVPDPLSYDYRAMYVLNGELYATKHTYYSKFVVKVSKFNGSVWGDLPGEFTGPENYRYLYALGEYQGKLVAGGVFDSVNGTIAQRVAMFDGTNWTGLNFPVAGPSGGILEGKVYAFKEFEGKLFVGGIFANFQDTIFGSSVASYDGSQWKAYPFDGNLGAIVYDFKIFKDNLIASGDFGYWQGSNIVSTCVMFDTGSSNNWSSLNFYNPLGSSNMNGQSLAIVNGTLYIGGRFDYAGTPSTPVHNVARFTGDLPTGVKHPKRATSVMVYPNPANKTIIPDPQFLRTNHDVMARIIDIQGREVLRRKMTKAGINIEELVPGLYTMILESAKSNFIARFVKSDH
ncbi:MAG: T9SS type A sorting domain-containing protein [Bacteroidales bacterium]|nr:T9SS type A sorting domain-containing protein [Bacteroidales bacterium]